MAPLSWLDQQPSQRPPLNFSKSTSLSAKFAPSLSLHRHARLFSPLLAASAVQVVLTLQGLARFNTCNHAISWANAGDTHAHNQQGFFLVQFLARVRLRACRIDDAKTRQPAGFFDEELGVRTLKWVDARNHGPTLVQFKNCPIAVNVAVTKLIIS
ncbi:hypothetical protein MY4824_001288, partial [Beauveria thailandica]